MNRRDKIVDISLDESTGMNLPPEIADEQHRAIQDLLVDNEFRPINDNLPSGSGPYRINLKAKDQKLIIEIDDKKNKSCNISLSLKPFHRIMKDYSMVCDSYYKAVKESSVQKIEALDMGRRGLHDEGAMILQVNLEGKIECDFHTARRLFTLMYVLFVPSLR